MKKNKSWNYKCYKGMLHTFGEKGSSIYHKRIYYRNVLTEDGATHSKEILTGREFPTVYSVILRQDFNVNQFVSGNTIVFDSEIDKYLKEITSDKRISDNEVSEILVYEKKVLTKKLDN